MKRIIIITCLTSGVLCHSQAQQFTTTYGQYAYNYGDYNSYFGYAAAEFAGGPGHNTGVGAFVLQYGGKESTAVGSESLSGGQYCTAVGYHALRVNHRPYQDYSTPKSGDYNTGVGYKSLEFNVEGDYNTAVGSESLINNKKDYNSAFGYHALHENDDGSYNSATGSYSLYANTTGYQNTAVGGRSLYSNTTGYRNTAVGMYSLNANLHGVNNTATGSYALYTNNMGNNNTGHGYRALNANTTGSYNTAQGSYALDDNFGGNYNTAVGYNSGPTVDLLSNTTAIGYQAVPTASNQVRIGNTSVTSIGGYEGWTDLSDGRFKKDVKEDVSGLEFISQLRPVSYTVDKESLNKFLHVHDSSFKQAAAKSIPVRKTGFIAQEVEALIKKTGYVFSGVDAPENENDPYGIRYSEFVVPLVKAVQELSAQVQLLLAERESENEKSAAGTRASLFQNNPNPFDAETEIKMTLPDQVSTATVIVYNLEGKQLKNIQVSERGDVKVRITANELSAGMYLYTLIADGKVVDTKRMVLTK